MRPSTLSFMMLLMLVFVFSYTLAETEEQRKQQIEQQHPQQEWSCYEVNGSVYVEGGTWMTMCDDDADTP